MLGVAMHQEHKLIHSMRGPRAPTVSFGAAPGTIQARTCVRHPVPTTTPAAVTATSASVSVSNSSKLETEG